MYLINSNLNFHFSLSISDAAFKHVAGSGVKQYFRVHPQNLQVLEGTEALLRCEIGNLGGSVQWAKDGFALGKLLTCLIRRLTHHQNCFIFARLGFSEKIPGYPRYSMIGDRSYGVYNLRIVNASLDDDAEYQCQVGPSPGSDPIRTVATLTVICK